MKSSDQRKIDNNTLTISNKYKHKSWIKIMSLRQKKLLYLDASKLLWLEEVLLEFQLPFQLAERELKHWLLKDMDVLEEWLQQ